MADHTFADPFAGGGLAIEQPTLVQKDYRLFRYSKAALPFLLLLLLSFVALFCLTLWQGDFSIKTVLEGIPRDLEPQGDVDNGDSGMPRENRNLRLAVGVIAVLTVCIVALVYYLRGAKNSQKGAFGLCALLLFVVCVLAVIAFGVDVGKTDQAQNCITQVGASERSCVSKESTAHVLVALDLIVAFLALFGALCLAKFGIASGTLASDRETFGDDAPEARLDFQPEEPVAPKVPGQPTVHRNVTFICLTCLLIASVLLIVFTVFLHENRERVTGQRWDPISNQAVSGWPRENSRLRAAVASLGTLLCLLSFVPYPHRVYNYAVAYTLLATSLACFVCFGLDVNDLNNAQDLQCPDDVKCVFHPYRATVVMDIICGILALAYVAVEFLLCHARSMKPAKEGSGAITLSVADEYYNPVDADQGAIVKADPLSEAPMGTMGPRPVLGVEVLDDNLQGQDVLRVDNVKPGSACYDAGLQAGDIITRWNEAPVTCKRDFGQLVSTAGVGDYVQLQVLRGGMPVQLPVQMRSA